MNHNIKGRIYAKPVYQGAANAFTSVAVPAKDINSLGFLVNVDATGATIDASNKLTFTFTECDTLGGTYVAAPADAYYANHPELNSASMIGATTVVEYRGSAAFVKLVATETGTAVGNIQVTALSLHPETMPAL